MGSRDPGDVGEVEDSWPVSMPAAACGRVGGAMALGGRRQVCQREKEGKKKNIRKAKCVLYSLEAPAERMAPFDFAVLQSKLFYLSETANRPGGLRGDQVVSDCADPP